MDEKLNGFKKLVELVSFTHRQTAVPLNLLEWINT